MMWCLQDSMRNILMWVTIYDPFASKLGIDENWNWLDYPWIFIVPLLFFLYVESLLSNSKFSRFTYTDCIHHQQNVNQSGSHMQTSQTFLQTSPVLPSNYICSQASLELSKVLSDSARAFSGAPESTCSYGGVFRMPWDVTYTIVKYWSCRDLCAGLRET